MFILAALARALIAHACGETLGVLLEHLAPGTPPLLRIALGLALGVTLVELVVTIRHQRNSRHDPN